MSLKEEIINDIKKAFKNVILNGGVSLKQAIIIDSYGEGTTEKEFREIPNSEITKNWEKIPISQLDTAEYNAHLDNLGFKYYIPALMIRLLENYSYTSMVSISILSSLYPKTEDWSYHMEKYSSLNDEQGLAIANYLKSLPVLINLESEDNKIVERAFKNYWSKFMTPSIIKNA